MSYESSFQTKLFLYALLIFQSVGVLIYLYLIGAQFIYMRRNLQAEVARQLQKRQSDIENQNKT
jgi:hypothetical protein